MTLVRSLRVATLAHDVDDVLNSSASPIFLNAELDWSRPSKWEKGEAAPVGDESRPCLYAILRKHGKSHQKVQVEYIGLTTNPQIRFANHHKAQEVVGMRGDAFLTLAVVSFIRGRNKAQRMGAALQDIEHILIWAVGPRFNERKQYTFPGMGRKQGSAWHITNTGYRFSGLMPMKIIYPWMVIVPGRDRSAR